MRTNLSSLFTLLITLFSSAFIYSQTFTWNGSVSSSWNNSSNWTPTGIPVAGDNAIINNPTPTNACVLDVNVNLADLTVNNGASLDFAGFTVTATDVVTFNDAILSNVNMTAATLSGFADNVFNGNTVITKTSSSDNNLNGGNTFNGNLTLTNTSTTGHVRFSNVDGDTYNGNVTLNKNNTGEIQIARNGASSISGNLTVNTSSSGNFSIGAGTGTLVMSSGSAFLTGGFTNSSMTVRGFTQNGSVANGSFNPTSFTAVNSSLGGNFSATTTGNMVFTNASFLSTNIFTASNIDINSGCNFSTSSGTTTFTKNGGSNDQWEGGCTFGNLVVNLNSTTNINLGQDAGDTFLGNLTLNKLGTGSFSAARSGVSTLAGNLTLNTNQTGFISTGATGGTLSIASGFALLTSGYTNASLFLRNITQNGSAANGSFSCAAITVSNCNFGGDISLSTSGTIDGSNSIFQRSATFTGANVDFDGINGFSTVSGTTTVNRTGGSDLQWDGGNTFGNVVFNINSNSSFVLAQTTGDVYQGTITINKGGTGSFVISRSGTNTIAGNITINTTTNPAGSVSFGNNNGTTSIASGSALLTSGFANASLTLRRITQNGSAANGSFSTTACTVFNCAFGGSIGLTSTTTMAFTTSSLQASNTLTSRDFSMTGVNNFSNISGSSIFTKTGGSTELWNGGGTFGTLTVNNNSTNATISISQNAGCTFLGDVTLSHAGTGGFSISRTGTNNYAGNITINNTSTGTFNFGINNGSTIIASGGAILTTGFTNGTLNFRRITQNGSAPNGTFGPSTFTSNNNCVIRGDISITRVSGGTISITSSQFRATNVFRASQITVTNACQFSTTSGSTTFTKTGTTSNTWFGGNTYGDVVFNMNAASGFLRLANNAADTYNGNATFLRNAAGDLQPSYNHTCNYYGDISTVGTTLPITFGANNGRVALRGNVAQSINGSVAQTPVFRRLTVNKTSNDVILNVPISITTNVTFTNRRIISSSTNLVIIQNGATATGASNASFVVGPVRKVGNQAFTFPLGSGSNYAPIGISAPAVATDHFTADHISNSPDLDGFDVTSLGAGINQVSGCEYWDLSRTNGTSNVFVTLHWDNTRCGGVVVTPDLRVSRWNGTQWTSHGIGTVTGTPSAGTITTSAAVSSFSPFVLSSSTASNPLPITLLSFEASVTSENSVRLDWATASERDNDFFSIEKSKDGQNWEVVTTVDGAGNSINRVDYSIIDEQPYSGLSYYRLKQTDFNGDYEYFDVVSVSVLFSGEVVLFPNPTTEAINLTGISNKDCIKMFNALGETISVTWISFDSELNKGSIDVSNLNNGVYLLIIEGNAHRFVKE